MQKNSERPCLEQNYYEVLDQDNVNIVDISEKGGNEIVEFTENGIKTKDGKVHEADVIALATGFDITTGGMTQMVRAGGVYISYLGLFPGLFLQKHVSGVVTPKLVDTKCMLTRSSQGLKSIHGTYLKDEWKASANTYLGLTVPGYPNMFHIYGPHGPTLLSNGPSSVSVQGRWIRDAINMITRQGIKYVDATKEASVEWKKRINDLSNATLMPTTRSTYMGGSVPGKAFEQVNFAGGIGVYRDEIRTALNDWKGFKTVATAS